MANTQSINYNDIWKLSETYDSMSAGARAYDAFVKQGQKIEKAMSGGKGIINRTLSNLYRGISGVLRPALYATGCTLKRSGKNVVECGKGVLQAAKEGIDTYTASQNYEEIQDMYKNYTGRDTEDRTKRMEAETKMQGENIFTRTAKGIKKGLDNAKAYGKLEYLAAEMRARGMFTTPFQAYALRNGDMETFTKLLYREQGEPKVKVRFGGKNWGFSDLTDFSEFMKGMGNFYFMSRMDNEMRNNKEPQDTPEQRTEIVIDPSEVEVDGQNQRKYKALLTEGNK